LSRTSFENWHHSTSYAFSRIPSRNPLPSPKQSKTGADENDEKMESDGTVQADLCGSLLKALPELERALGDGPTESSRASDF
jgi:hypothetical protein